MRKVARVFSIFIPAAFMTGALIYGQAKMGPINPLSVITNTITGVGSGFVTITAGSAASAYALAVQNYNNTANFFTITNAGIAQFNQTLTTVGQFIASGGISTATIAGTAGNAVVVQGGSGATNSLGVQNSSGTNQVLVNQTTGQAQFLFGSATTGGSAENTFLNVTSSTWIKVGTWVANSATIGDSFMLQIVSGYGYGTNNTQQAFTNCVGRSANGTAAPNFSGINCYSFGQVPFTGVAAVATGASTSTTNTSWDIYVNQGGFAGGNYLAQISPGAAWTNAGTTASSPGAASSTVVLGTVFNPMDYSGSELVPGSIQLGTGTTTTLGGGSITGASLQISGGTMSILSTLSIGSQETLARIPLLTSATVAAATTITPTTPVTILTGTTAIATITVAGISATASAVIYLLPQATSSTVTTGNISAAVTLTSGTPYMAIYDTTTSKWKVAAM